MLTTTATTTTKPATPWVVDVNASVTHGPFVYAEAVVFSERVLAVPGVVDTVVRPRAHSDRVDDDDVARAAAWRVR